MSNSDGHFLIACLNHNPPDQFDPVQSVSSVEQIKLKSDHDRQENPSGKKREIGYRMTLNGSNLRYLGKTVPDYGSSESANGSSWHVLIRNRQTGKTTVTPAKFVTFNAELQAEDEFDKTIVDKDVAREMRQKLTMQYGSKKKKRALESKFANSVNNDSLSNMINLAMSQVQASVSDNLKTDRPAENGEQPAGASGFSTQNGAMNPRSSVLPPFNSQASVPSEIFDLNDLVSPEEVLMLTEEATNFAKMTDKERREGGFNFLVCELTFNLPNRPEAKQTRCVYLLYLDYLLKLFNLSNKMRSFQANLVGNFVHKPELTVRILDKYAEKQSLKRKGASFRLLPAGKDRLLSHMIILILSSNEFSFSLSKLMQQIDMPEQKITAICNILGCKTKKITSTGEKVITLTKPPEAKSHPYLGAMKKRKF